MDTKHEQAPEPPRWKWFFAHNGSYFSAWDVHIEIMLTSAAANTTLDPYLIYSGEPDHPILPLVERYGVTVIHRKSSILPDLERMKAKFPDFPIELATGSFLRIDLPHICRELRYDDEHVIYTDCDVVFLRDIPPPGVHDALHPYLFSCAPELSKAKWGAMEMNSGVMVMNVKRLVRNLAAFKRFITAGDTLNELVKRGFDQRAYQLYYEGLWSDLPLEYNWKPYWGFNEEAVIVHFHGPKIPQLVDIWNGNTQHIRPRIMKHYLDDPAAYRQYFASFERYFPAWYAR
jgi:hypothetical protein